MDPRLNFKYKHFHTPNALNYRILSQIKCPVYVIGARNGFVGQRWEYAKRILREKFRNTEVHMELADGGHHCHMEEENVEAVGKMVSLYLEKLSERWELAVPEPNADQNFSKLWLTRRHYFNVECFSGSIELFNLCMPDIENGFAPTDVAQRRFRAFYQEKKKKHEKEVFFLVR